MQTKCVHAPWASYNTPYIELIQYGRYIGKKVYFCFSFVFAYVNEVETKEK